MTKNKINQLIWEKELLMLTEDENTKLLQYFQVSRTGVSSIINNQTWNNYQDISEWLSQVGNCSLKADND